jgi:hypothetical protein
MIAQLILFYLTVVFATFEPLDRAVIYFEWHGDIKYMPTTCAEYSPYAPIMQCTFAGKTYCEFGEFFRLHGNSSMVKFYTVDPEHTTCQRDTITLDSLGLYRLTIDQLVMKGKSVYRFSVTNTELPIDNDISVKFVLGYKLILW